MFRKTVQLLGATALIVFSAGCGDDDDNLTNPPAPSSAKVLMATLDGAQQVPPLGGATGSGTGSFVLSADRKQVSFNVSVGGLTGGVSAAHFHNAAAGANGGVVRDITADLSGNSFVGTWTSTDNLPLTEALVTALLAGEIYVNVHTIANPQGEIRGQVMAVNDGQTFSATIAAAQQVPPVIGVNGTGSGFFKLNATETELMFYISFDGLTGAVTAAHFHNAAAGANGGVARGITGDLSGNSFIGTWRDSDGEALTATLVDELKAGRLYINIHTAANASGEIRGQVLRAP